MSNPFNQEEEKLSPVEKGGPSNMYDAFKEMKAKAEARGEKRGETRGREIGEATGEARGKSLALSLAEKLISLGRLDDVSKAASNPQYRDQLLREFAIQ